MDTTLVPNGPTFDAAAIQAIREGDRERYRELVERYSDKVFAVAWCRLGDRTLAEEAAQEAFISGYRHLALLGRAEKFGVWITAIARNAAVNLGLRRRGELKKRERWAIEFSTASGATGSDAEPASAIHTVREGLASLAPIHRECLVLFYLEGNSVSEASQLLGLSETAFKTRLHRARVALRSVLESKLESSLRKLRPSDRFAGVVMLALPAEKPALSLAGAVAWLLGKIFSANAILFAFQILSMLPGLLFGWWLGRKDAENFRDPKGFRARNQRRFVKGTLIFVAVAMILIFFTALAVSLRTYCRVFSIALLAVLLITARQLFIIRHRLMLVQWLACLPLGTVFAGIGFFDWPIASLALGQGLFFFIVSLVIADAPLTMDTSLFLRAANGLLKQNPPVCPKPAYPRDELMRFARFLGARLLIQDWREYPDALRLRLAQVTPTHIRGVLPILWGDASTLTLTRDGGVRAHLGKSDARDLAALQTSQSEPATLEAQVASTIESALPAFIRDDYKTAESILGQELPASVFRNDPTRAAGARWRVWTLRVAGTIAIITSLIWWAARPSLVLPDASSGVGPPSPPSPDSLVAP